MAIHDRRNRFCARISAQVHAHMGTAGSKKAKVELRLVARTGANEVLQQLAGNGEDFVLFR